ncbi:MAG TPA: heterodisulfide reductase-related iron-sulfur binding cluster, partial [Burkholderiaceae bacterium]|nr:heterodisulfide reductase-related iron-sulfur binding cluster [Burkholderiaceae bacterium]
GCCGAIRYHLNDQDGGLDDARRNIDAWWPLIEGGAEAIVMNASGCGLQVKEYGHMLGLDPAYAARAKRVSELTQDIAEVLSARADELRHRLGTNIGGRVAFHSPCTLQHGLKVKGAVEALLTSLGATVSPVGEGHFCCGSAGTYSVLQPELSIQLRDRRLGHLQASQPEVILSANIGCITHLQGGTDTRVMHWIEWLDERLGRR